MLNEEVRDKLSEKREYDFYLLKQVLMILFALPSKFGNKADLIDFYVDNVRYSKLEKDILKIIKSLKYSEDLEDICDDMLDNMDDIFLKIFQYNEWILDGYMDAIATNEPKRAVVPMKRFDVLTDEDRNVFVKKIGTISTQGNK